jgi:hypothetical protein
MGSTFLVSHRRPSSFPYTLHDDHNCDVPTLLGSDQRHLIGNFQRKFALAADTTVREFVADHASDS